MPEFNAFNACALEEASDKLLKTKRLNKTSFTLMQYGLTKPQAQYSVPTGVVRVTVLELYYLLWFWCAF